jgi:hypothetical protein
MKNLILVLIFSFVLIGCDSESVETNPEQVKLPTWLIGEYDGVHTQEFLVITNDIISFKVDQTIYQFHVNELNLQGSDENSITFNLGSETLYFNKTTLASEINFQFNELNLGWFRKQVIE